MRNYIFLIAVFTAVGCSSENQESAPETVPYSATELLEAVVNTYEDRDYYQERTVTRAADDSDSGNDENVTEEYYWEFHTDDGLLTRLETHDQNGQTEYEVTIVPNRAVLHYTEGEEDASIEDPDQMHASPRAASFRLMLDEANDDAPYQVELSEVAGEETYQLVTPGDNIFFRQDDYAEIYTDGLNGDYSVEVTTHEWDPEFDITLFEREGITSEDVQIIDRRGLDDS
ncbi:hypothetical protein [Alkalicoccus luteus]|uniref:Uncharacterized protein n=1 Tax=Alkalicoccus luteus TaxID=1237094 RepID=A0A969PQ98_9BACI|nr:hypothetical protein [Alkalicoccus luteus]NJP38420.1 hypothetical protein [Alkalicoccus luteus]